MLHLAKQTFNQSQFIIYADDITLIKHPKEHNVLALREFERNVITLQSG